MSALLFHVDAFADAPFSGNPAAVCLLDEPAAPDWMQAVACEMNLSETAFVVPGAERFDLRWFTPGMEVDLCGHATLASAHILWQNELGPPEDRIEFETRSGVLGAELDGEWILLDFPSDPPVEMPAPEGLEDALGCSPTWFGESANYHFAEVVDEETLRSLAPDFRALAELVPIGVCVTVRGDGAPYDLVSRFFAPGAGIDEDPVTGSAHCQLAPYWSERLGKSELLAFQASRRGGVVRLVDRGDRVELAGRALTVARGRLVV